MLRRGGECQPMAPAFEVLLLAMAALVAFGAAAAISLWLGSQRGRLAQRMLTIIAIALLVLAGAAACVLAY
jgi:hypothetical protein